MFRHYVYLHRRNDTGEVFYVGKGSIRPRRKSPEYGRATARVGRNPRWIRTADKHGFTAEIFASCESDEEAQRLEREIIAQYGRADSGTGPLVNMTDGGDGHAGILVSDDLRKKRSVNARGKRSDAWVTSIRKARAGGGNGGVVKAGDKLPQWWKDRIAATKVGDKNPMFGRGGALHPGRRAVVNESTGEQFPTITAAAKAYGMNMQSLHNMLTGARPNRTSMRLA